jgi:hypothetical protein
LAIRARIHVSFRSLRNIAITITRALKTAAAVVVGVVVVVIVVAV